VPGHRAVISLGGALRDRHPVPGLVTETEGSMATAKQTTTARRNVKKAKQSATRKKTIAHLGSSTRTALGKQGAAVAQRKRAGGNSPKTRAELYEIAKQRDLPGRSKMGRDELARKLGAK
jgi:hypothetical protein